MQCANPDYFCIVLSKKRDVIILYWTNVAILHLYLDDLCILASLCLLETDLSSIIEGGIRRSVPQ
jgi:hypothetical protein